MKTAIVKAKILRTALKIQSKIALVRLPLKWIWWLLTRDASLLVQAVLMTVAIFVLLELVLSGLGLTVFPIGMDAEHEVLTGILIGCTAITAFLAYIKDSRVKKREEEEKAGLQRLGLCEKCFEQAYDLLKDRNNNRMKWVEAARLLLSAQELGRGIRTPVSKDGYILIESRFRSQLFDALTLPEGEHQSRQSLPTQFFFGIENWSKEPDLFESAARGSAKSIVGQPTPWKTSPLPGINHLALESVVVIFNFLRWPEGRQDLLRDVEVWPPSNMANIGFDQGARNFVQFQHEHLSIDGRVLHKASKKVVYPQRSEQNEAMDT